MNGSLTCIITKEKLPWTMAEKSFEELNYFVILASKSDMTTLPCQVKGQIIQFSPCRKEFTVKNL